MKALSRAFSKNSWGNPSTRRRQGFGGQAAFTAEPDEVSGRAHVLTEALTSLFFLCLHNFIDFQLENLIG